VILDIHLPDRSGVEVLKTLKRSVHAPMVVVLTNSAYPELERQCLEERADFFLDKAKDFEKLFQIFGGLPN
jgi:CheY-like chemotaxis protein